MYRNLILDFMSQYRDQFINNQCTELCFVFFNESKADLGLVCGTNLELTVYHVKEPYIFEKKYNTDQIMGTIIEIALDATSPFILLHDKISYEVKDPYYFRDLREFKMVSLVVVPFFHNFGKKDQQLSGIVIVYSNMIHPDIHFSNQRLLTLQRKLYEDQIHQIVEHIKQSILSNEKFQVVVRSKIVNAYYCNDQFKQDYHLANNYVDKTKHNTNDLIIKKALSSMHKQDEETYTFFYTAKRNDFMSLSEIEYFTLDSIHNHQFSQPLSLIYLRSIDKSEEIASLAKILIEIATTSYPESLYKFYKVDEYTICQLVNQEITKKLKLDIAYRLKKRYYHIINIPNDLAYGVDLQKVINYFQTNLPDEFVYEEYSTYLNQKNEDILLCDAQYPRKNKILIAAANEKEIGEIIIEPIPNFYDIAAYKIFEQTMIAKMESSLKQSVHHPVFTLLVHTLIKRKVQEVLKKIINQFPMCKLILHIPPIIKLSCEKMYEMITKLKSMGFVLIADSTIFMNLEYHILMKQMDAIIIRDFECQTSLSNGNPHIIALLNSYYDEGKVVVFACIPQKEDVELINQLTCLIIER